ncbi:MAG: 2-dehydro-3-deoxy-6-phosphogalactonate aldolase [Gemmatimonadota bacterium]|nr:2-dehydro-3-deoxy-6-phosphogalactonate aldolase [Gemmatimonadota bacterium]
MIQPYLDRLPLIAILRGITPDEVVDVGGVLVAAGFAIIEIPLNSPSPCESIRLLQDAFGTTTLIGAGTVMNAGDVARVVDAGGRLIVMPHSDPTVMRAAKERGMLCVPGVVTPTEGFAALANGADGLKLFPAELVSTSVVKAMRSVFPADARLFPVGGITADAMEPYVRAGATGFGLGSALYKRGDTATVVAEHAAAFVFAWHRAARGLPIGQVMRPLPRLKGNTQ